MSGVFTRPVLGPGIKRTQHDRCYGPVGLLHFYESRPEDARRVRRIQESLRARHSRRETLNRCGEMEEGLQKSGKNREFAGQILALWYTWGKGDRTRCPPTLVPTRGYDDAAASSRRAIAGAAAQGNILRPGGNAGSACRRGAVAPDGRQSLRRQRGPDPTHRAGRSRSRMAAALSAALRSEENEDDADWTDSHGSNKNKSVEIRPIRVIRVLFPSQARQQACPASNST